MSRLRSLRGDRLLPLACIAAALLLAGSDLLTMFNFTPPGAEPLSDQSVLDRHGVGLIVLAAFAIAAVVVAVANGSKPAAFAVGVIGVTALLIFLIVDLPDAGKIGTLPDSSGFAQGSFFDAEAVPQAGFWLEMIGALALAISGTALATLSADQLAELRPGAERRIPSSPLASESPLTSENGQQTKEPKAAKSKSG